MLETAHAAALHASRSGSSIAAIQIAKLHWMKGQQADALQLLSENLEDPQIYQGWSRRQQANVSQHSTTMLA